MNAHQQVESLLNFIDASPSPWHAVTTMEQQLIAQGFTSLLETEPWHLKSGGCYYVIRDDSSLIAFQVGSRPFTETGFKIVGAHTDSPGLRVKPKPVMLTDGLLRIGVEVYGGPILATFTDRDLSLAGRISYQTGSGELGRKLLRFEKPLLRLPNLAIHMNRKVNEEGLKLHKQNELPLILSTLSRQQLPNDFFYQQLEQLSGIQSEQIINWEFHVYDTQKGAFWGAEQQFYADSQLDNLASCHAGLTAMLNKTSLDSGNTLVCAFFDHEEIGSESNKGAAGCFLPDVLERMVLARGNNREDYLRALAQSFMISADMAHAYQPNFADAYEPGHKVMVNKGPVIKSNANLRYTTESVSEAVFIHCCQQAGIGWQQYSHRTDIACGSTIGPMVSAKLGIRSVDIGNPMWAMHSVRESAGVQDHGDLIKVLNYFFGNSWI